MFSWLSIDDFMAACFLRPGMADMNGYAVGETESPRILSALGKGLSQSIV
jgi:hypothetical protein